MNPRDFIRHLSVRGGGWPPLSLRDPHEYGWWSVGRDPGAVVAGPGAGDVVPVVAGPVDQRGDRVEQAGAQPRELVVDPGWHHGVHRAGDEAIPFELAQGEGEHPLADAVDLPAQLAEAPHPAAEQLDHEQRPFVAQAVEQVADLTRLRLLDSGAWGGNRGVTGFPGCA